MKTFNIDTETMPVSEFAFAGNQESKALETKATRAFKFRYLIDNRAFGEALAASYGL